MLVFAIIAAKLVLIPVFTIICDIFFDNLQNLCRTSLLDKFGFVIYGTDTISKM